MAKFIHHTHLQHLVETGKNGRKHLVETGKTAENIWWKPAKLPKHLVETGKIAKKIWWKPAKPQKKFGGNRQSCSLRSGIDAHSVSALYLTPDRVRGSAVDVAAALTRRIIDAEPTHDAVVGQSVLALREHAHRSAAITMQYAPRLPMQCHDMQESKDLFKFYHFCSFYNTKNIAK